MEHPLSAFPRGTVWHLLQHFVSDPDKVAQAVAVYVEPSPPQADDLPIAERLIEVFHAMIDHEASAVPLERRPNEGIWEMVRHEFHGPIYQILLDKNVEGLAEYLRNGLRESVCYGLGPGPQHFAALREIGEPRAANVLIILDRLAALAEAVGALPYENPEQGRYGINTGLGVTELIAAIERTIGTEIHRPPVMGICGLRDGADRIIDCRVPDDVYGVHRMRTIKEMFGLRSVCEIGGGFGGAAFQAIRNGFHTYTIFDLPVICIVQGFFLMKIFGSDQVRMFGKDVPDKRVNILPYWSFFDRSRSFDLVFNRDSLPEMPRGRAIEYLTEIAERRAVLLSINQEAEAGAGQPGLHQLRVSDLCEQTPGMQRVARHPYWMRKGYVEEVYRSVDVG